MNLAPYSFFNAVSGAPPMIAFSGEGMKDSAHVRLADARIRVEHADLGPARGDERQLRDDRACASEFDHAGLKMAPSRLVAPPRVRGQPIRPIARSGYSADYTVLERDLRMERPR